MSALWDDFNPRSYREGFRSLLAGCVQGERHEIGIQMVSDFLRRDGWHVTNLGADVPESDILRMASRIQPPVCLLSAAQLQTAQNLRGVASRLLALPFQTRIMVGGSVFRADPTLAASFGPAVFAVDAAEAVLQVHRLLGV